MAEEKRKSTFEKREVYVVTIWLKEEDEEGNPLNWSGSSEEYYAETLEQAEKMKQDFLDGKDPYYGDLVEDCWISDEKEERELLVWKDEQKVQKKPQERTSVVNKLQDAREKAAGCESAVSERKEMQRQNVQEV